MSSCGQQLTLATGCVLTGESAPEQSALLTLQRLRKGGKSWERPPAGEMLTQPAELWADKALI